MQTDVETSRRTATGRGDSPHVLNYINRNLYSNQHQIMMEACKRFVLLSGCDVESTSSEESSELEGLVCE